MPIARSEQDSLRSASLIAGNALRRRKDEAKCVTLTAYLQYNCVHYANQNFDPEPADPPGMAKTKISTLNLRIHPAVKHAVREAAALEHRSVANMVEMLIRRHCDQAGIRIAETPGPTARDENA